MNMTVEGFVLAGGRSRRMGRDKAWLDLKGRPMIDWTIQRLLRVADRVTVIGGTRAADRLRALGAARVLEDCRPGEGPLMGVFTGLMAAEAPVCIFVPCDMPLLASRLVTPLVAACAAGAPAAASLHPRDGLQPFPLACRADAAGRIGALLDRGERSLKSMLFDPRAHLQTVEDPALWPSFTNVNTEADYAALAR